MSFLHHDAKVDRIGSLPLFKNAERKALEHIAEASDEVQIPAGKVLIREGTFHSEGYIIEKGSLSVSVGGKDVATIPAGQMVGEVGLFGHGPASATVTTAEDVVALVIPNSRFDQMLDEVPGLAKCLAIRLAERLHEMDRRSHQE